VQTSRFGVIAIDPERVVTLPLGMPGFPEARAFVVLDHRPGSIFRWLQSIDDPSLAFVVIDPLLVHPDYPLDLVRRSLAFVDVADDEPLALFVLCTVPPAPGTATANFMAPVGVGIHSRRGAQVVLHDSPYGPRDGFLDKIPR
jgi:flagellar assembly factor FliW